MEGTPINTLPRGCSKGKMRAGVVVAVASAVSYSVARASFVVNTNHHIFLNMHGASPLVCVQWDAAGASACRTNV